MRLGRSATGLCIVAREQKWYPWFSVETENTDKIKIPNSTTSLAAVAWCLWGWIVYFRLCVWGHTHIQAFAARFASPPALLETIDFFLECISFSLLCLSLSTRMFPPAWSHPSESCGRKLLWTGGTRIFRYRNHKREGDWGDEIEGSPTTARGWKSSLFLFPSTLFPSQTPRVQRLWDPCGGPSLMFETDACPRASRAPWIQYRKWLLEYFSV